MKSTLPEVSAGYPPKGQRPQLVLDAGAVGPVWVRGAYANGKKHGPWLTFDKAGKVFQPAVEDAWKDHTPVRTWVQQTAGQVGSGS